MFGFFRNKEERSKEEEEARLKAAQRYGGWLSQNSNVPTKASHVPTSAYAAMALARHHSTHKPEPSIPNNRSNQSIPQSSSHDRTSFTGASNLPANSSRISANQVMGANNGRSLAAHDPTKVPVSSTYVPRSALLAPSAIAASKEFDKETKRKLLQLHQWLYDVRIMQHQLKIYASSFVDLTSAGMAVYRAGASLSTVIPPNILLSSHELSPSLLYGGQGPTAGAENSQTAYTHTPHTSPEDLPPLVTAYESFHRDLSCAVKTAFSPFLVVPGTTATQTASESDHTHSASFDLDIDMGQSLASASRNSYQAKPGTSGTVVGHHPVTGFSFLDFQARNDKNLLTEAAIKNIAHAEFPSAASARALAIYLDEWIDDLSECQSRLLALQQAQSDLEGPMEVLNNLLVQKAEADAASNVVRKMALSPRTGRLAFTGGASHANLDGRKKRGGVNIVQLNDDGTESDRVSQGGSSYITDSSVSGTGTTSVYIPPGLREAAESIAKDYQHSAPQTPKSQSTVSSKSDSTSSSKSDSKSLQLQSPGGSGSGSGSLHDIHSLTQGGDISKLHTDASSNTLEPLPEGSTESKSPKSSVQSGSETETVSSSPRSDSASASTSATESSVSVTTSTSPSATATATADADADKKSLKNGPGRTHAKTPSARSSGLSSVASIPVSSSEKILRKTRVATIATIASMDGESDHESDGQYEDEQRDTYGQHHQGQNTVYSGADAADAEGSSTSTSRDPTSPSLSKSLSQTNSRMSLAVNTSGSHAPSSLASPGTTTSFASGSGSGSSVLYAPSFPGSSIPMESSIIEEDDDGGWTVEQELALRNAKTVISVKTQALAAAEARSEEAWARTEDNVSRSDEAFSLLGATVTSLFAHLLGDEKSARAAADSWTTAHKAFSSQREREKSRDAKAASSSSMGFGKSMGFGGIWLGPGKTAQSQAQDDSPPFGATTRQRSGSMRVPQTPPRMGLSQNQGMSLVRPGSPSFKKDKEKDKDKPNFGTGWQKALLGGLAGGTLLSPDRDSGAKALLASLVEDDGEGGSSLQQAMRALEREIEAKNQFKRQLKRMQQAGDGYEEWSTDDEAEFDSDSDAHDAGFSEDDSIDEWSTYDSDSEAEGKKAKSRRRKSSKRLAAFTESGESWDSSDFTDSDEFLVGGTESDAGADADAARDEEGTGDIWEAVEKKLKKREAQGKKGKKGKRRSRKSKSLDSDAEKDEKDDITTEPAAEDPSEPAPEGEETISEPTEVAEKDLPPVCPDLFDEGLVIEMRYINGVPPCPDLFDEFSGASSTAKSGSGPSDGNVQGYVLGPNGIPYCPDLFNEFSPSLTTDETAGMTPAQKRAHLAAQKEKQMWKNLHLPPALPYNATRPLRHLHWNVINTENAMEDPPAISLEDLAAINDLSRTVQLASPMDKIVSPSQSGVYSRAATESKTQSIWRHIADREILLRRKYKMEIEATQKLLKEQVAKAPTPEAEVGAETATADAVPEDSLTTGLPTPTVAVDVDGMSESQSGTADEVAPPSPVEIKVAPIEQMIGEELFPEEPSVFDATALSQALGLSCSCPTSGTLETVHLPDGTETVQLHTCEETVSRHLALLPPLDPVAYENMFATDIKGKTKEGTDVNTPKVAAPVMIELIDRKRAYNISIALRGFKPLTPIEVVEAVGSMHEECLSSDKLQRLVALLPTQAEQAILSAYRGPASMLAEPEQLLYAIIKAPFFREHLRAMIFALDLPELSSMVRSQMNTLRSASMQILRSPSLQGIIQLVLRAGNFLNQTTKKGRAFAFSLPILAKLRATKTGDLKGNLLTIIADHIENTCPSLLSLPDELAMCIPAARIDAAFVKNEVANFQLNLIVVQQLVTSYASNAPEEMQQELRDRLQGNSHGKVTMERDESGALSAMVSPIAGNTLDERELMERIAIAGGAPPKLARFATKSTDEIQDILECWELTVRVVEHCAAYLREPDFANDWPALFGVFAALCTDLEHTWAENAARRERDSRMRARESGIQSVFNKGGNQTPGSKTNATEDSQPQQGVSLMKSPKGKGIKSKRDIFEAKLRNSAGNPVAGGLDDLDGKFVDYEDETDARLSTQANQHLAAPELDSKLTQLARHHSRHISQVKIDQKLDDNEWDDEN